MLSCEKIEHPDSPSLGIETVTGHERFVYDTENVLVGERELTAGISKAKSTQNRARLFTLH